MGKNIWSGDEDEARLQSTHPGCMWGVIHALNYHHWNYNIKKMVLSQSHNRTRREKGNERHKKRTTVNDADDIENLLDVEPRRFFVDESRANAKTCSTNRKSLRARIKALISDEISKEDGCRPKGSFLPTKSQLRRTYSIHYLDPSVLGLPGEGNAESGNSVPSNESFRNGTNDDVSISEHKLLSENHTLSSDKFEEARESLEDKRFVKDNQHGRDKYKCREHADVLELFRVNQDLFLEYLKSTDDGIEDRLGTFQTSNKLERLTRSGSFPAADVPRGRNLRPSKLKNKQEETWPFLREEKMFSGARARNLASFKFLKDVSTKSGPITLGRRSSSCNEIDASACDLNKTMSKHRRTVSLNGSMERYTQLLETGFSREAKLHQSKSLKLAKEYELSSGGHAPISFKRVRSLPHADSNWTLQNGLSSDSYVLGVSNTTVEEISQIIESDTHSKSKTKVLPASPEEEIEALQAAVDRSTHGSMENGHPIGLTADKNEPSTTTMLGIGDDRDDQTIMEKNSEEQVTLVDVTINNLVQPSQAFASQTSSEEDIINHTDYSTSEDLDHTDENELSSDSQDMEHRCTHIDANEVSNESQMCFSANLEDFETGNNSGKIHGQPELYTDGFNFVREILEQSGFQGNGFLEPWHSLDQPLNPLIFDEVDVSWPHEEPKCYGEKNHVNCHHQLLFDLVNEVIVQIYDCSFTYYPKALSSNCHLRPLPSGHHFVDEVWARISRITSLRPQVDESVAYDFPKDLGKDDGWMNLQFESECVALELEDWIFDELLEEVLCS